MRHYIMLFSAVSVLSGCAVVEATDCLIGTCQEQIDASNQRLGSAREEGQRLGSERDATLARRNEVQRELADAEASYAGMQRDLAQMKHKLSQAGHTQSNLMGQIEQIEDEIALRQLGGSSSNADSAAEQVEQLQQRKTQLETQIKALLRR